MTTPTALGISRLAYEFSNSEKFKDFLLSFLVEYDALQISGLQLLNDRYIDTAIGAQLDGIGEIVGLQRPVESIDITGAFGFYDDPTALGFGILGDPEIGGSFVLLGQTTQLIDDASYRLLIRAKIIENATTMSVDDTLTLISFIFGGVDVIYSLPTNLNPRYDIDKALSDFEINLLDSLPVLIGIDPSFVTYAYI